MTNRWIALIVTLVLAVLTSPLAGASAAAPTLESARAHAVVPVLDWQPCGPGLEAFQCATAQVPVDYDDPRGRTTTIALTRLPASGPPGQRLGTLFTNPGGPGGSGVDFVQQAARLIYARDILDRYDVVGFDPRGVARSGPATCFRTEAAEQAFLAGVAPYPVTAPQERRYVAQAAGLAVRCQTTSPGRLSVASTANVARDLDLLRQAVGDRVLTYAGYSYGTFLGATYAALFPRTVGRFVLDGTLDPIAYTGTGTGDSAPSVPLGIRVRQGLGADETFGEFARLCRRAGPGGCSLAGLGDPAAVVRATLDRLLGAPVVLPLPDGTSVTFTQQVAVAVTFTTLYSPTSWPALADLFTELAATPTSLAGVAAAASRTRSALGARLRGEDYPSFGGALASVCVDTARSGQLLRYPLLADRANAEHPYFGRYRAWIGLPCELWALRGHDVFTGPWRQTTTAPVLVVGTRFDPATPYRRTRPYADLFPNARVLTLDGWGHTSLGKSGCVDAAVAAYLVSGRRPVDGATCAPDTVPFTTAAEARTPARPDVPPGLPLGW